MALKNLFLALTILSLYAITTVKSAAPAQSPKPAVDCSNLILEMTNCLSYVSNGSTTVKPEASCCSGLKTVLKASPDCLCVAFKSSAQLGVVLNVTKAAGLPAACHVAAPSITTCGLSPAGASPVASPASSPMPFGSSPGPSVVTNEETPAPAPGKSGAAILSASVASLVLALAIACLSSF